MTTPISVSETDLHTMLRIVNAPDGGDDGEGLPWSTLEGLKALIPCDFVAFNGLDVQRQVGYFGQATAPGDDDDDEPELPSQSPFWLYYWDSACAYPERTGDVRSVTKTSDFYTRRQYHQTPIYIEHFGLWDQEYLMKVCLPDGPGRTLRLIYFRGKSGPDFTERDRALLTLLRPHLHAAHQGVLNRRRGIPNLTARQWELLRLVDAGHSNRQIARRLNVTENTVRKHLENIFQRLGVTSRTAAVARAFPARTGI